MPEITMAYIETIILPVGREVFYWDEQVKGFGLRVTPAGKITYVVQGRVNGRSPRISIGQPATLSVEQARQIAVEHLQAMRLGVDPRAVGAEPAARTMSLRDVAEAYQRNRSLSDTSKQEIERHLSTVFAGWLDRPIVSISSHDVTRRFNEIRNHAEPGSGSALVRANQSMFLLRTLFNYAISECRQPDGTALMTDNPVDVLYRKVVTQKKARGSHIPMNRVGAVWSYLLKAREAASSRDTQASLDIVMFVLLTGARIVEASTLTWNRVNLAEASWQASANKSVPPIWLPLSAQAVALLGKRPQGRESDYVFASWGKSGHLRDPRDTIKKISAVAGTALSPQSLRRSFNAIGTAACGIDVHKLDLLTSQAPHPAIDPAVLLGLRGDVQHIADWIGDQARSAEMVMTTHTNTLYPPQSLPPPLTELRIF